MHDPENEQDQPELPRQCLEDTGGRVRAVSSLSCRLM